MGFGSLVPSESGEHIVTTKSNDGIRLWIDDSQVINNWTDHSTTEDRTKINLTAKKRHAVRLEYFYNGGDGITQLSWTKPSGTSEVIPSSALLDPTSQPGLKAEYFAGSQLEGHRRLFARTDLQVNFPWGQEGLKRPVTEKIETIEPELQIPAGNYQIEWFNPEKMTWLGGQSIQHPGSILKLKRPTDGDEFAIRVRRN